MTPVKGLDIMSLRVKGNQRRKKMKAIEERKNGVTIEHFNCTLERALLRAEEGADLYLVRYDDNGLGNTFIGEALIGNTSSSLTKDNYYAAYDKIF